MRYLGEFVWGITLPARASFLTIRNPRLWPWILLPTAITIAGYYLLWANIFLPWQTSISDASADALAGLFGVDSLANVKSGVHVLINILMAAFFWIVALFSFSSLSNLATLPVNDFLAEAVEPLCTPALSRDYPSGLAWFFKALIVDLRKSIVSIAIMIVTFIFSWIPIMNIVAVLLVALALTLQYSGYASTRRGLGVRKSIVMIFKTLPISLGFGLACMVLLTVPLVKLFIPSIAVVAGTMLFARASAQSTTLQ